MSREDVDRYLAGVEEPKRRTLEALRLAILEVIPDAEECISYGMPAFRIDGKVIAGFAAFKNHLSYLPHSGSVISQLGHDVVKYKTSSGALQFRIDQPLPKALVRKLIAARRKQVLERMSSRRANRGDNPLAAAALESRQAADRRYNAKET